jgi:secreted Zn-dependent insulinase-like peptidase
MNALYKGRLPQQLREDFEKETRLTQQDIIQKVYREPQANRFLASTSEFISRHLDVEPLRQLVVQNFRDFFSHNIVPYQRPDLPVSFVGSMAYHYENELQEAARAESFTVGKVMKSPMEGLIAYHSSLV